MLEQQSLGRRRGWLLRCQAQGKERGRQRALQGKLRGQVKWALRGKGLGQAKRVLPLGMAAGPAGWAGRVLLGVVRVLQERQGQARQWKWAGPAALAAGHPRRRPPRRHLHAAALGQAGGVNEAAEVLQLWLRPAQGGGA